MALAWERYLILHDIRCVISELHPNTPGGPSEGPGYRGNTAPEISEQGVGGGGWRTAKCWKASQGMWFCSEVDIKGSEGSCVSPSPPSAEHRASVWVLRMRAKSLPACRTLCDPMDCSLPGFSIHGVSQARITGSRGSFWTRDQTLVSCISCIGRQVLYLPAPPGKPACLTDTLCNE